MPLALGHGGTGVGGCAPGANEGREAERRALVLALQLGIEYAVSLSGTSSIEQVVVMRPVVDFLIIGSMKSGTTSLHTYLEQHPQISMSSKKEVHFFSGETWDRGIEWYAEHFDSRASMRGEASTSYSKFPLVREVPRRIHATVPDVKLVYLVRDPVERVLSHLHHNLLVGIEEPEDVTASVRSPETHYVDVSRYWMQLRQYLEFFPAERILVLTSEELRTHPQDTLRRACTFLSVDASHRFTDTASHRNVSGQRSRVDQGVVATAARWLNRVGALPDRLALQFAPGVPRPTLDVDTRTWLVDSLRNDVEGLESFIGRPLTEWKSFRQ